MPSKASAVTAPAMASRVREPWRYHSTTELDMPKIKRARSRGSRSPRTSPSRCACAMISVTSRSNARRRSTALRSLRRRAVDAKQHRQLRQQLHRRLCDALDDVAQPVDRAALASVGLLARRRFVEDRKQRVERASEPALEQRFLPADVVVDRCFGDPGRARDVVHRCTVVAAVREHAQGDVGQRVDVVRFARLHDHGDGVGDGMTMIAPPFGADTLRIPSAFEAKSKPSTAEMCEYAVATSNLSASRAA